MKRVEAPELQPFEREERYIVIKRKHLNPNTEAAIRACLRSFDVSTVECVVVESDWPENEIVWRMIEDRMTGASRTPNPQIAGLVSALEEAADDLALSADYFERRKEAGAGLIRQKERKLRKLLATWSKP